MSGVCSIEGCTSPTAYCLGHSDEVAFRLSIVSQLEGEIDEWRKRWLESQHELVILREELKP